MSSLTDTDLTYFHNKLYLPLLLKILEKDQVTIQQLPIKLQRPYITLIDKALDHARADLKKTEIYMTRYDMKLIIEKSNKEHTAYAFIKVGHEERFTFTSTQLRSKTEELLFSYLTK